MLHIGSRPALFAAAALSLLTVGWGAVFAEAPASMPERFAGEAQLGSQPRQPIHIELQRSDDKVTGAIAMPGAAFELVDARGRETIVGGFRGKGGSGKLTLRVRAGALTGDFALGGQAGTITAERTQLSASAFFRPPEQRLDLTTAQWVEDHARLVAILTREHGAPFHRVSAAQFQKAAGQVRAALPRLDGFAVFLEFRKLAALIGDGHTAVAMPRGRKPLPLELYWFDDGLRVVRAGRDLRQLVGAKLVAVNGVPVAEVLRRAQSFVASGETRWFVRDKVPELLRDPGVLQAIVGAAGPRAEPGFAFTFEATDGARREVSLDTAADGADGAALAGDGPLWRRDPTVPFSSVQLPDDSVYVNWRGYAGLADHGAALLRQLDERRPRRLIVDLRDNQGGNLMVGRDFIAEIRRRPWLNRRGVLFVLIGRRTFSAAMTNAVDFKRTTSATLVGEPAGAAPNAWQEVRRFNLPHSGLTVGVSTRRYEFLPGHAVLKPDHHVAPTPDDWSARYDRGVQWVLSQPIR